MNNLSWLDALAVASFLIGVENLNENVGQSAIADAIQGAVDDIHRHLQEQDRRLENMERMLENAENQKMVKQIKSELHDAEKYAKCALEYKGLDEEIAALYYRLACEEMEHMELLHGRIVATIADYRRKTGEPPAAMRAVWEYEHAEMMEEAAEIKGKIARFKE